MERMRQEEGLEMAYLLSYPALIRLRFVGRPSIGINGEEPSLDLASKQGVQFWAPASVGAYCIPPVPHSRLLLPDLHSLKAYRGEGVSFGYCVMTRYMYECRIEMAVSTLVSAWTSVLAGPKLKVNIGKIQLPPSMAQPGQHKGLHCPPYGNRTGPELLKALL